MFLQVGFHHYGYTLVTETPSYRMGSLLGNHSTNLLAIHHLFVIPKTEIKYFKLGDERQKRSQRLGTSNLLCMLYSSVLKLGHKPMNADHGTTAKPINSTSHGQFCLYDFLRCDSSGQNQTS